LTLNPGAGVSNDYSGGTFVNGGTLNLSGAASTIVVPGALTINNSTVTMNTNQGQIATSSVVTLNGGGVLNLTGANTLNRLVFNNAGGTTTPLVALATQLTLSATNAITVVNDNYGTTPTISGTALAFTSAPTIDVSGLSPIDLIISAPITSAGGAVTKTGAGALVLSGARSLERDRPARLRPSPMALLERAVSPSAIIQLCKLTTRQGPSAMR
jgi:hypothetical protein